MKNKVLLISSIVLFLASCSSQNTENTNEVQDYSYVNNEYSDLSPEEAQVRAESTARENRLIFSEAVAKTDASICAKIESYDLKFSCEQNANFKLAVQKKDVSLCSKLETEKGKTACKNTIDSL